MQAESTASLDPVEATLRILRRQEGFEPKPYLDSSGVVTIGYGHRIRTVDQQSAETFLQTDYERTVRSVCKACGPETWARLSPVRRAALVALTFNSAPLHARKFALLLKYLREMDWRRAASEILIHSPAGSCLAEMTRTNEWPSTRSEMKTSDLPISLQRGLGLDKPEPATKPELESEPQESMR